MNGEVILAPLPAPPPAIYKLLTKKDPISKIPFVNKIKAYNQLFAFTSIGTKLDTDFANEKKGAYSYRIQGDHYHEISSLLPKPGEIPKFSQKYYHDSTDFNLQLDRRHKVMQKNIKFWYIKRNSRGINDIKSFCKNLYIS